MTEKVLYGISNCDTVKKARRWLDENRVAYRFHDYKKHGVSESRLRQWCEEFGHERLINRRGTAWRRLPESEKTDLDAGKALQLMMNNPSIIKRPLLETGENVILGFDPTLYEPLL